MKGKERKHVPACAVKGAELLRACKQRVRWETRRVTTLPEPAERPADNRVEGKVSLLIKVKRICCPRAVLFNCGHLDVLGKKSKQRFSWKRENVTVEKRLRTPSLPTHVATPPLFEHQLFKNKKTQPWTIQRVPLVFCLLQISVVEPLKHNQIHFCTFWVFSARDWYWQF